MKYMIKTLFLILALSSFAAVANAQSIVVSHDDFNTDGISSNSIAGTFGAVAWNFSGAGFGSPVASVTNDLPDTLVGSYDTQTNCAFTFNTTPTVNGGGPLNFGLEINWDPATGNTNKSLRAYTLQFDMAIQGVSLNALGGFVAPTVAVFGNFGGLYFGDGCMTNPPLTFFPAAGTGYVHYSLPLNNFIPANANLLPPTDTPLNFCIGFYMAGLTVATNEEIDIANVEITMTNPPPLAPPAMSVKAATPGLRLFAENTAATYNQEGFGVVDASQGWVGVATPSTPVSYSINFKDFNTVPGYTLYAQFVPNAPSINPYIVYAGADALVWNITASASGFTTAVNWKTNAPTGNEINNAVSVTTTSTTGVGTWTLSFTSDTNGTVTAPDGTKGSFTLDPSMAARFANPVTLVFGEAPNSVGGYGQYIDFNEIAISNVVDGTEIDDFTQDTTLNPMWSAAFSLDPGSVIQVPAGSASYWVNWTVPDEGFASGLETKASLIGGNNAWFSPNYYGNGVATITGPTLMGTALKWALIPSACLPTVDGTQGGMPSTQGFFRLSNPPPTQ